MMVFAPTASGTLEMVQTEARPLAVPDATLVDQVMAIVPAPPEAVPDMLIAAARVVDDGTATVSVSGGAGVGGFVASCAA